MKYYVQKGMPQSFKKALLFFAEDLEIANNNATVRVRYVNRIADNERHLGRVTRIGFFNIVYDIEIKRESRVEELLTLAHEMIHVSQMETKIMQNMYPYTYWRGRAYRNDIPYSEKPWEQEAHKFQGALLDKFLKYQDEISIETIPTTKEKIAKGLRQFADNFIKKLKRYV